MWLISLPLVLVRLLYSRCSQGKQLCHGHMIGFTARLLVFILFAISGSQFKVPSQTAMHFSPFPLVCHYKPSYRILNVLNTCSVSLLLKETHFATLSTCHMDQKGL